VFRKAPVAMMATFLVAACVVTPISARAQNAPAASPQNPPTTAQAATDPELEEMKKLAEQATRLKTDAEAALQVLDTKQNDLNNLSADAKAAQQWVEGLINVLQELATRYTNDSQFMQSLAKHEDYVRGEANKALSSVNPGDHLYGRQLDTQAKELASMVSEGRAIAGKLAGEIDRLKNSAPQISFARTIERTAQFIQAARGYLATARGVLEGAANLATKAESIVRPTVPTQ
jgi:hypothetical protein